MAKGLVISIIVILVLVVAVLIPVLIVTLRDDDQDSNEVTQSKLSIDPETGDIQIWKSEDIVLQGHLGSQFDTAAIQCELIDDSEFCFEWTGQARLQVSTQKNPAGVHLCITSTCHTWTTPAKPAVFENNLKKRKEGIIRQKEKLLELLGRGVLFIISYHIIQPSVHSSYSSIDLFLI